jgi:endo-1,4-beta-xylanase
MSKKQPVMNRRSMLLGMSAVTVVGGIEYVKDRLQVLSGWNRDFKVFGTKSLRDRAAAKGLIYGATSLKRILSSDTNFAAHFAQECGILVPEAELKWQTLRPSLESFNFAPGDWLLEFTREHKIKLRGHTLIWHGALPSWFAEKVDRRNVEQVLKHHIERVVTHYAGEIHSWDVVNEAIALNDGRADGLRKTPWLQLLGPEYFEIAFHTAAQADPKALLVYNDYSLDFDSPEQEAKRTAVLKLLERLKSRGVPIHALGTQAHLWAGTSRYNSKKLRAFLHEVASMGLKILVTEMDVADKKLPKDINLRDRIVAGMYEDYLSVVLDEPAVIAVLTWGLSDRYTWLSGYQPRADKAPVRPLPLDDKMNRKLAWNAIARAFDRAPKRSPHST